MAALRDKDEHLILIVGRAREILFGLVCDYLRPKYVSVMIGMDKGRH